LILGQEAPKHRVMEEFPEEPYTTQLIKLVAAKATELFLIDFA